MARTISAEILDKCITYVAALAEVMQARGRDDRLASARF
jgi:hypothetical protein